MIERFIAVVICIINVNAGKIKVHRIQKMLGIIEMAVDFIVIPCEYLRNQDSGKNIVQPTTLPIQWMILFDSIRSASQISRNNYHEMLALAVCVCVCLFGFIIVSEATMLEKCFRPLKIHPIMDNLLFTCLKNEFSAEYRMERH